LHGLHVRQKLRRCERDLGVAKPSIVQQRQRRILAGVVSRNLQARDQSNRKTPAHAGVSLLAVVNDLCSNHWNLPFTPDELRKLATPGERGNGSNPEFSLRSQPLPRRLGPKKVTDIMQRYEAGESARSLADRHGVATSALIRLLRENNVVVRKRKVTDAETRRMAKDYEAGATMRELEAKYGLSHGAVSRALHRSGVKTRASAPRRKRD